MMRATIAVGSFMAAHRQAGEAQECAFTRLPVHGWHYAGQPSFNAFFAAAFALLMTAGTLAIAGSSGRCGLIVSAQLVQSDNPCTLAVGDCHAPVTPEVGPDQDAQDCFEIPVPTS